MTVGDSVDSSMAVCGCDSKKSPNNTPLLCPKEYGVGDELAVVGRVGRCKMASLRVCGLA